MKFLMNSKMALPSLFGRVKRLARQSLMVGRESTAPEPFSEQAEGRLLGAYIQLQFCYMYPPA
jgi:hypothetical protein